VKTEYKIIIVATLLIAICILLALTTAEANDRSGPTQPGTPTTYSSSSSDSKTIPVQVYVAGAIAIGITVYCVYRRWWVNDPCLGAPATELKKTTAADDKMTPDNLQDEESVYLFRSR